MEDDNGLYIMLLSLHGLVRGDDIELGRDADTGGQVKYVVELARALGEHKQVRHVDLITRQIFADNISDDYAIPLERLDENTQIIRIPCGPRRYLSKEALWPYLDEFVDNVVRYISRLKLVPDVVHGHYADAGLVASKLSQLLGVPMVFTGHSLGRDKLQRLLDKGMSEARIERHYRIRQRIEAEEISLGNAWMVVTSTGQERDEQYNTYENHHPERVKVLPPGVDLKRFSPHRRNIKTSGPAVQVNRFLRHPQRPLVLALSRPDPKKNIQTLVRAFAETPGLSKRANLAIVAGNRDDLNAMEDGSANVLRSLLLDIDRLDLYGHIAYPKHHAADDVPDYYRLAAYRKGVFVNPALTEPFGLTLLEAAASGLPVVATNNGGPSEILARCANGRLVDPTDAPALGQAILGLIDNPAEWARCAKNGVTSVRKHYSWNSHAKNYVRLVKNILGRKRGPIKLGTKIRLPKAKRLVITDIDNTLIGDADALAVLVDRLQASHGEIGFGVATGRHFESTIQVLQEWGVPMPDILICAVGSEIYYGPNHLPQDEVWHRHIGYRWRPDDLEALLANVQGLRPQPPKNQGPFKRSFYYDPKVLKNFHDIRRILRNAKVHVKIIASHSEFLDFLPVRASKGLAVRHLCLRWGMPLENVLVAGDSGNDKEMLSGDTCGVVVGNYSSELKTLRQSDSLYFAQGMYAQGVIEGMDHYGF